MKLQVKKKAIVIDPMIKYLIAASIANKGLFLSLFIANNK
jgi:hypothetical protein